MFLTNLYTKYVLSVWHVTSITWTSTIKADASATKPFVYFIVNIQPLSLCIYLFMRPYVLVWRVQVKSGINMLIRHILFV